MELCQHADDHHGAAEASSKKNRSLQTGQGKAGEKETGPLKLVHQAYIFAVGNSLAPSEFWRMHPAEFWWFYEAKTRHIETPDDKWGELYDLLKEGK